MPDVLTIPIDGLTAEDAEAVRALAEGEAKRRKAERAIRRAWPAMRERWGWYLAITELAEMHKDDGFTFRKVKSIVYGEG